MKLTKIVEAFKDVEDKIKENGDQGDAISHPVHIADQSAIKNYTDDSRAHNDLLHRRHHKVKGGARDAAVYREINTIQRIIHKQEPLPELHVFSGVQTDIDALIQLRGVKPFSTFEFFVPSFISTTTAFKSVDSYAKLFNVADATSSLKDLIKSHNPNVKYYRNILCFDMHGQRALKIDAENGGVFGDSEKEFILPHSATVKITGTPTIKMAFAGHSASETAFVVWDAELEGVEDKEVSHDEDSELHSLDVPKLKNLVFGVVNRAGIRLSDQIEYRLIRAVARLAKMYEESSSFECSGREMSYFEEHFLNLLFELQDGGVLYKHKHDILQIFQLLSANKKSLLASPLADTRPKAEVAKLLDEIF